MLIFFITSCSFLNVKNNNEEMRYFPTEEEHVKMGQDLKSVLPADIELYYLSQLTKIYTANDRLPIWADRTIRYEFEMQLAEVALAGVQPQFSSWVRWLAKPELKGISRDIVLTDALLGYLQFIQESRKIGNKMLYESKPLSLIPSSHIINELQIAIKNRMLKQIIDESAPQNLNYKLMRNALHRILKDQESWPPLNIRNTLKPGDKMSIEDFTALQTILKRQAIWNGQLIEFSPPISEQNPYYNNELVNHVKVFQRQQGMDPTGILDPRTRKLLTVSPTNLASKLALNMQRLHALPAEIDTVILVNIPDYGLRYYVDGRERFYSKTIVGRIERKTPIMLSKLNNVVLNPPWNVPPTLLREDVIPKIKHDPDYLKRNGFTMYDGWSKNAVVINPEDIDWSKISLKDPHVRIQQSPGRNNSLGRFKFNMPNADAIYLHDTPNHNSFNKDVRALSSGCIRVNKASVLAEIILSQVGWDKNKMDNALSQEKTVYVNISNKIPVYLFYMTIWIGDNGTIQIRDDIYGYDNNSDIGQSNLPIVKTLLNL